MKNLNRWAAFVCVIALLGVIGCSDDDDPVITIPDIDAATAQAAVEDIAGDVAIPLNTLLNAVVQILTQVRGEPFNPCDSGTAVLNAASLDFTTCAIGPITINGSIGYNVQTLALDFAVTVNGASVTGPGQFSPSISCGPGIVFQPGFEVDGEAVVGTLEVCSGTRGVSLPTGSLIVTLVNPPIIVELSFDGGSTVQMDVRNLTGDLLFNCTVNILSLPLSATCA